MQYKKWEKKGGGAAAVRSCLDVWKDGQMTTVFATKMNIWKFSIFHNYFFGQNIRKYSAFFQFQQFEQFAVLQFEYCKGDTLLANVVTLFGTSALFRKQDAHVQNQHSLYEEGSFLKVLFCHVWIWQNTLAIAFFQAQKYFDFFKLYGI